MQWKAATIIGLFLLLGGNGRLVWAEQYIPSGIASLFIATTPLWMVLIDNFPPGGKSPDGSPGWGCCSDLAGIILLITPGKTDLARQDILTRWDCSFTVCCIFMDHWLISTAGNPSHLPRPLLYTGMEMLAGSAGLFVLEWIEPANGIARIYRPSSLTRSGDWLTWSSLAL